MTEKQTTVETKVKTLKNGRRAFTLVELITVIAITGVLLSIIIVPLFQGFNFTRTAQAYGDAQDRARILVDRLTTEIGSASLVRDPNGVGGLINIEVPVPVQGQAPDGTRVNPSNANTIARVGLPFAKLDIVLPSKEGRLAAAPGVFIDPATGKVDPTLTAPKGQVTLPAAPGQTIRRYWIGRRDPFQNYSNPYDGLLARAAGGRDNLYVLYTAEVQPYVTVPSGAGTVMATNTRFFETDPRTINGFANQPILDDPNFFLPDRDLAGNIITNNAKALRIRNWIRRATILTEVSRYDMVLPAYDRSSRLVSLDQVEGAPGQFTPRMVPLLQLKPSRVSNDPTTGQTAARIGEESDNGVDLGPEVFRGQYGQWSNLRVRIYPSGFTTGNFYVVGRKRSSQLTPGNYPSDNINDFSVYLMDPADVVPDTDDSTGLELFNSSVYSRSVATGRRYPFSDALSAANSVSGWLGSTNTDYRDNFMPFVVNSSTGAVITGFPIGSVGNPFGPLAPGIANLPERPAGDAFTPTNDPAVGAGTFSDAQFASINRMFNKVWADARNNANGVPAWLGEVGGAHRFVDLRVTPQLDGTLGPLHPTSPLGAAPGSPLRRCRIVPGSEEVFGPDQNPGPNYGTLIRYRRVTREPGPNEYRINYADLPDPDYAALGLPIPPATYAAGNFVSAVIQPRFRAGYIQLCSQPEVPIPAQMTEIDPVSGNPVTGPAEVRVAYRFQFTGNNDIVAVDYDTRDLISILLTIRNYPQSTVPNPQTVTLKATAAVRNFTR